MEERETPPGLAQGNQTIHVEVRGRNGIVPPPISQSGPILPGNTYSVHFPTSCRPRRSAETVRVRSRRPFRSMSCSLHARRRVNPDSLLVRPYAPQVRRKRLRWAIVPCWWSYLLRFSRTLSRNHPGSGAVVFPNLENLHSRQSCYSRRTRARKRETPTTMLTDLLSCSREHLSHHHHPTTSLQLP